MCLAWLTFCFESNANVCARDDLVACWLYLQLYEGYDDSEIGALDQDDIEGCLQHGSTVLNSLIDEFEKTQKLK